MSAKRKTKAFDKLLQKHIDNEHLVKFTRSFLGDNKDIHFILQSVKKNHLDFNIGPIITFQIKRSKLTTLIPQAN